MDTAQIIFFVVIIGGMALLVIPDLLSHRRQVTAGSSKKRKPVSSKTKLDWACELFKICSLGYLIYLGHWFMGAFKWFVTTLMG